MQQKWFIIGVNKKCSIIIFDKTSAQKELFLIKHLHKGKMSNYYFCLRNLFTQGLQTEFYTKGIQSKFYLFFTDIFVRFSVLWLIIMSPPLSSTDTMFIHLSSTQCLTYATYLLRDLYLHFVNRKVSKFLFCANIFFPTIQ